MKEFIPNEFVSELKGAKWYGKIKVIDASERHCIAEVSARGTSFTIALSCYFEGYGMKEWCLAVPNFNFGCKLSGISVARNEENFKKYIKNEVDRRSLSSAVEEIIKAMR